MLNRIRLFRRLHVVQLQSESCSLLLVPCNLALQPSPQSLFPAQPIACLSGLPLGRGQGVLCLRNLSRQSSQLCPQARALQLHFLQLYEVFNVLLHPYLEVYGIHRLTRNCPHHSASNKAGADARLCENVLNAGGSLLTEARNSFLRRHRWIQWVAVSFVLVLIALAGIAVFLMHRVEPFVRASIVAGLQQHFHARVELDSFHMSLKDGLKAEGGGLRIWPPAQVAGVNVPANLAPDQPLISLGQFRFQAPLHFERGQPFQISTVELKDLDIHLPPRSHFIHGAAPPPGSQTSPYTETIEIGTIECTEARLVLETDKPGKLPLEIPIAHLTLTHVSSAGAMDFVADLTNPRPHGAVHTTGSFGPWAVADPGESPVTGQYTFDHADLSDFKGIAGILSSKGNFEGTLRQLTADGQTSTPDFRLTDFGQPLPLTTTFHARIDATNGDTVLEPVDATLGHSHFTARGQVARIKPTEPISEPSTNSSTQASADSSAKAPVPLGQGKDIDLNINIDRARIEDFLRLTSRSGPPTLTGNVTTKARLHIPPGTQSVERRMTLKGSFVLDQAVFTSEKIQDDLRQLSLRGQGRPKEVKTTDPNSIQSTMVSDFQLVNGAISLPDLTYTVPGAKIRVNGTYNLDGGAINFVGTAAMDATVSQMLGGILGVLAKPADRFFKKDGAGTEIPFHVSGTRDNTSFGIDFNLLKKNFSRPSAPPSNSPSNSGTAPNSDPAR